MTFPKNFSDSLSQFSEVHLLFQSYLQKPRLCSHLTLEEPAARRTRLAARRTRPSCHAAGETAIATWNLLFCILEPALVLQGVYKPPAVPWGAALGAHYPAGTQGDIQAVHGHSAAASLAPW